MNDRVLNGKGDVSTRDPLELFRQCYAHEKVRSKAKVPGACCLSTIGTDGYPNARFLALKDVTDEGFVVTGPLSSRKGQEIRNCPKVALTFWWPATERQVRVQGEAISVSEAAAERYFHERPFESQLLAVVSRQGDVLEKPDDLKLEFEKAKASHHGSTVARPADWGGFCIQPVRIEFLEFNESRLHRRTLFEKSKSLWKISNLQP